MVVVVVCWVFLDCVVWVGVVCFVFDYLCNVMCC